jgi:hypothetical protein
METSLGKAEAHVFLLVWCSMTLSCPHRYGPFSASLYFGAESGCALQQCKLGFLEFPILLHLTRVSYDVAYSLFDIQILEIRCVVDPQVSQNGRSTSLDNPTIYPSFQRGRTPLESLALFGYNIFAFPPVGRKRGRSDKRLGCDAAPP